MSGHTVELKLTIRVSDDDLDETLADVENHNGQLSVNIGGVLYDADLAQGPVDGN
jgi:hypothetical protein